MLVDPVSGLTEEEEEISNKIAQVWDLWTKLPVQHKDDITDIIVCVHQVQGLLMQRVCRRAYPEGWPIKP